MFPAKLAVFINSVDHNGHYFLTFIKYILVCIVEDRCILLSETFR